jgi:hypothetical protein
MPTASAVMADVVDYATGRAGITFQSILRLQDQRPDHASAAGRTQSPLLSAFHRRRPSRMCWRTLPTFLGRHEISISSVRQDETDDMLTMNRVLRDW